jgi:hypothetical protein
LGLAREILDSLLSINDTPNPNNINTQNSLLNTSRNDELCKYAYFKYLFATGDKRGALDRLKEFSINLASQLSQYQQFLQHQQQQQLNMAQIGAQLPNVNQQFPQPQLPASFNMLNPRDIQKRRTELEGLLAKCYLKLGQWSQDLDSFNSFTIEPIITYFKLSKDHNNTSYKSWQSWAYANYEAIQFYKTNLNNVHHQQQAQSQISSADLNQQKVNYVKHAIKVNTIFHYQEKLIVNW